MRSKHAIAVGTASIVVSLLVMLLGSSAFAQGMTYKTIDAGSAFIIPGLGAIVVLDDGKLKVDFIPPANSRPEGLTGVDLEEGDVLLMCNGKRLKAIEDLEELYDALEVGTEVKFGVRRKGQMLLTKFNKPDPADAPAGGMQIMTMTATADDGAAPGAATLTIDGGGDDMVVMSDAGLIVREGDAGLTVLMVLPNAGQSLTGAKVAGQEVVTAIQGKTVKTATELQDVYDTIESGDNVTLTLVQDGTELEVSFTRNTDTPGTKLRKSK
ncbi:MAG: PDZ domain-containing protein [candidate division Zixibacteria bacterium]|nr:PDZ domain-containing protein [candidate division Zixibacteria bacterium]